MKTIQLEGIELRPNRYFDITAEAEAVTNQCESSSEAGESEVTEAWEERELDGFEIVSLVYWPNEDTPIDLPTIVLNHDDRAAIFEEALRYI